MTRITFLLHYMLERLEVMGDWSLRRINTPDGYACLMKVGKVEFLWCNDDVATMYLVENEDWGSKLTLHEKVSDCILNGVTYEKGEKKGGEMKPYMKIGECGYYDGKRYRCVPMPAEWDCSHCDLKIYSKTSKSICARVNCLPDERRDGTNVMFVLQSKYRKEERGGKK